MRRWLSMLLALCMVWTMIVPAVITPAARADATPVIALTYTPGYGENRPFQGVVFRQDGGAFDPTAYRVTLYLQISAYEDDKECYANTDFFKNLPAPTSTPTPLPDSPIASGTCGDNLTWKLNQDGTLTVSGTGAMDDFNGNQPWSTISGQISALRVDDGVTRIGDQAFIFCSKLKEISIAGSVREIGQQAFRNCKALTELTLPEGLVSIGDLAFDFCNNISSIHISSTVKQIGNGAFANVAGTLSASNGGESSKCALKNITVSAENPYFTSVDGVLFNKGLETIICYPVGRTEETYEIPSGVTKIGHSAFCGSRYLKSVTIPNGVTSIAQWAFRGDTALQSVTIPGSVREIGLETFTYCNSLESAVIEAGVPILGHSMFLECENLESVFIPASVTVIEMGALLFCDALSDIYYAGSESQWNAIDMTSGNGEITTGPVTIHYNSAGAGELEPTATNTPTPTATPKPTATNTPTPAPTLTPPPELTAISTENGTVSVTINGNPDTGASLFVALYTPDEQFLDALICDAATGENKMAFPVTDAAIVSAFLLDVNGKPLCSEISMTIR